jgi:hypothetical protein
VTLVYFLCTRAALCAFNDNLLIKKKISTQVFLQFSKLLSFIFFDKDHKRHKDNFPHNSTPSVANNPPISIQIDYSSRHNPRQPKSTKKNISNDTSNFTMKQKMIHEFLFTHTTPINHNDVPLPEIVNGKDLSKGLQRIKEGCPPRET